MNIQNELKKHGLTAIRMAGPQTIQIFKLRKDGSMDMNVLIGMLNSDELVKCKDSGETWEYIICKI